VAKQVAALLAFTHQSTPASTSARLPAQRTPTRDHTDAMAFRAYIDNHMPSAESVCAVCARYQAPIDIGRVMWKDLPGKAVLRVDDGVVALTVFKHHGVTYHLLPDVITKQHGTAIIPVCTECDKALDNSRVPPHSLKRVDAGSIPRAPRTERFKQLLPLTMAEERLVAPYAVQRVCHMLRPDAGQWRMVGHVIAFPNVPSSDLLRALPTRIEDIPNDMLVVFLSVVSSHADIEAMSRKSTSLHTRGPQISLWAQQLCDVYHLPAPDPAVLSAYENMPADRAPPGVIEGAVYARDEGEARALCTAFGKHRQGYANTHDHMSVDDMVAAATTPASGMQHDAAMQESAYMRGIDTYEIQLDIAPSVEAATVQQNARVTYSASDNLLTSVLPRGAAPMEDYDPQWPLLAHPSAFPNGVGARPADMSEIDWMRLMISRYPLSQYAHNAGLVSDLFNIWQRHQVNTHAGVVIKTQQYMVAQLATLTAADITAVFTALGLIGRAQAAARERLSPAGSTLMRALKRLGSHIIGSPQSFLSLRSKALSAWHVFGESTIMMNLCPFEIASKWVFKLAGVEYELDAFGEPNDACPTKAERKRIIAANFFSCAHFLRIYMRAFDSVMLGLDEQGKQINPDCIIGTLWTWLWKYEESFRGGLHAHGLGMQPFMAVQRLQGLLSQGSAMQDYFFKFANSIMCAYNPSPVLNRLDSPRYVGMQTNAFLFRPQLEFAVTVFTVG
jgi:hypothetical protein